MIQRKQSLFLLVAIALSTISFFSPIYIGSTTDYQVTISAFGGQVTQNETTIDLNTMYIGINIVLVIIFSLLAIFKYNNRALQMKICLLNIFIVIANSGAAHTLALGEVKNILGTSSVEGSLSIGYLLFVSTTFLYILSYYFIKKDEKLVKSVDRIR